MSPGWQPLKFIASTVGLATLLSLGACDRKPPTPPLPSSKESTEGPTTAAGKIPSGEYPAGIKPAASSDKVEGASTFKGPSEGGTAIGGLASGQAATSATGGAMAPTGGDGKGK